MKTTPTKKKFRVWIEQVNRVVLDVTAASEEEAKEKARREWKREHARPRIGDVVEE